MGFNWLVLSVVFIFVEMTTLAVVSIWFALGAVIAAVMAMLGVTFLWQLTVFVFSSLLLMVLFFKKVRALVDVKKHVPTNADRLVGQKAKVVEEINQIAGTGQILVLGETWSCRAQDGETIPKDAIVDVLRIEGVKAIVIQCRDGAGKGEEK